MRNRIQTIIGNIFCTRIRLSGEEALDHPAFKWNHLKADKMIEIQRFRASDHPKTAHTFGSDALALFS